MKPDNRNGNNPKWLCHIKVSNRDIFRRVMISIFSRVKILNDYTSIDIESITTPNSYIHKEILIPRIEKEMLAVIPRN
jgi:hypothetical protein